MKREEVLSLVRHLLTFVGAVLVKKGFTDDGTLEMAIGGVMAIASMLWSNADKKATTAEINSLAIKAASLEDTIKTMSVK